MFMIRPGSRPGAVDGETRTTTANTKLTNPAALAAFSPCRHTFSTPISAANPTIVHTFITPNAIINNINAQQHPTTPNNPSSEISEAYVPLPIPDGRVRLYRPVSLNAEEPRVIALGPTTAMPEPT
jgi:hypothetical protein